MVNVEKILGVQIPEGAKQWFTVSWFLFAVIGVPSYLLGHFELGHTVSLTLMLIDCIAIAYALTYGKRLVLAHNSN